MRLSDIRFNEELFYAKIFRNPDGCWEWQGRIKSAGNGKKKRGQYGQFAVAYPNRPIGRRKGVMDVHRLMWIISNGSVEKGQVICHKCNNCKCVRPDHLYAGTYRDNTRDSLNAGTHITLKVSNFCPAGHEYTPENTYIGVNKMGYTGRRCRECARVRQRNYMRLKSAKRKQL